MKAECKINILLVDDTPKKLLALEAVLECLGQNLIKASSGREALRLLLQKEFAVILLDVHMPDMDGFETAELIRSRKSSEHTPIIFVTSINTDDQHIYRGYALGAVDYIFTPVVPEVLQAKISVFIDLWQKSDQIRRSQEQLNDAQHIAHLGSWDWDLRGNVINWSEELYRIFGLKPGEFSGAFEDYIGRVHPDDRERVRQLVGDYVRDGRSFQYECRIVRPDKVVRIIDVRGEFMRGESGTPVTAVGSALDITEQKLSEQALRASEEKFRSVTETATEGIATADEEGKLIYFNRGAERMFGYVSHEVLGRPLALLLEEGRASSSSRLGMTEMRRWIGKTVELAGRRRDGSVFPVEISLATWRSDDRTFLTAIIRDVTRRNQIEQQLRENARELEQAQKGLVHMMKKLEAEIHERKMAEREILEISGREQRRMGEDLHDGLGQTLTGIAFMTKVLSKKLAGRDPAVSAEASKIGELVNQAIRKTRELARGFYPVTLETDGLVPALQELISREEELFKVSCSFRGPEEIHVSDKNKATQIYRIAQEAIENAIKHGRARHVYVNLAKAQKEIILTVQDDGIGIPKVLPRRNGMGLQLMKYRAGMIQGSFEIKRQGGGGTIMRCVFPESNGATDENRTAKAQK